MKKAQRILNELIKDLKEGNFKYVAKEEKEIDWAAYNISKIYEMDMYLLFVKEAVNNVEIETKNNNEGRPLSDAYDLAKIIMAQIYFQVAERQAAGLGIVFREKLGLTNTVSPSTIGRAYSRLDVQEILAKVFLATSAPIKDKETSVSGDGTGLPLSRKQNYANDRDKEEKHAGYDKMAVMISNNFHIATGFVYKEGAANDCPLLPDLMEQTSQKLSKINDVELDAGFVARYNCQAIAAAGAIPYIYPKTGITINQKGSPAWKKMLLDLIEDLQKWLEQYHDRSQSEAYFSAHKCRHARPILKRIIIRRKIQAFARVIATNICMLITAYFEQRVEVKEFEKIYL